MPSHRYERVSTPLLILKSRNLQMPHLVLTILLLSDLQTQILTPNLGSTRHTTDAEHQFNPSFFTGLPAIAPPSYLSPENLPHRNDENAATIMPSD
jgi:hypothetical protein